MFKALQKTISRTLSSATGIVTGVPTVRALKDAIEDGDEIKALEIYEALMKSGKSGFKPSDQLSFSKRNGNTMLHVAARAALKNIVRVFLEAKANPNEINKLNETALHAVCCRPDLPEIRHDILMLLIQFANLELESISINHVNNDGNSALHLAAANGLLSCIQLLIECNAIVSLVNKSQMTCCELAFEQNHHDLSDMLELALLFQPNDNGDEAVGDYQLDMPSRANQHQQGTMFSSSVSLDSSDIQSYMEEVSRYALDALSELSDKFSSNNSNRIYLNKERIEVLLELYAWDVKNLISEFAIDPSKVVTKLEIIATPIAKNEMEEDLYEQRVIPVDKNSSDNKQIDTGDVKDSGSGVKDSKINDNSNQIANSLENSDNAISTDDITLNTDPIDSTQTEQVQSNKEQQHIHQQQQQEELEVKVETTPLYETSLCPICMDDMRKVPLSRPLSSGSYVDGYDMKYSIRCHSDHIFCVDCWSQHLSTQVNDFGSYVLSCPQYKCKETLDVTTWGPYLLKQPTVVQRIQDMRRRRVVDCYSNVWRWCPHDSCNSVVICQPSSEQTIKSLLHGDSTSSSSGSNSHNNSSSRGYKTPSKKSSRSQEALQELLSRSPKHTPDSGLGIDKASGSLPLSLSSSNSTNPNPNLAKGSASSGLCGQLHTFCLQCMQTSHSPSSCQQWQTWQNTMRQQLGDIGMSSELEGIDDAQKKQKGGDDVANKLWLAANTKKCPKCSSYIEKDEGCNHMSCRKCRHEFCWICMQDWSLHNSATGGYFQCNRGLASPSSSSSSSDPMNMMNNMEDPFSMPMDMEHLGSAHFESQRIRARGQKMSVFIQHFTRYQAHSDSLKMEVKRMPENLDRVSRCLELSVDVESVDRDKNWMYQGVSSSNNNNNNSNSSSSGNVGNRGNGSPSRPSKAYRVHPNSFIEDNASSPSSPSSMDNNSDNNTNNTNRGVTVSMEHNDSTDRVLAFDSDHRDIQQGKGQSSSASQRLKWLQGSRTTHPLKGYHGNPKTKIAEALQCVKDGLIELVKCREFLKGSVSYSYCMFTNDDFDDNSIFTMHHHHRRNFFAHARINDHKTTFERLQSELEMYTEMLSDVVARRRFRASLSQIMCITSCAKSKRLEFEDCIFMYQLSNEFDENESIFRSSSSSSSSSSSLFTRHNNNSSNNSSNSNSNNSSRRRRSQLDQLMDLNNAMTRSSSSSIRDHNNNNNNNNNNNDSNNNSNNNGSDRVRRRSRKSKEDNNNSNNNSNNSNNDINNKNSDQTKALSSIGIRQSSYNNNINNNNYNINSIINNNGNNDDYNDFELMQLIQMIESQSSLMGSVDNINQSLNITNNNNIDNNNNNNSDNNNNNNRNAMSQRRQSDNNNNNNIIMNNNNNNNNDYDISYMSQLTAQAEEAAAINRAILMSLASIETTDKSSTSNNNNNNNSNSNNNNNNSNNSHSSDIMTPTIISMETNSNSNNNITNNNTNNTSTTTNNNINIIREVSVDPSYLENVSALVNMGFDRDASLRVLRINGNNLDEAINTLLS